jgi:hypothetical protein
VRPLPHILAGALVGRLIPHPTIALLGGMVTHAVLDAVPHTDGDTFQPLSRRDVIIDLGTAMIEVVAGLGAVACIMRGYVPGGALAVWAGALGGLLPDIIDFPLERLTRRQVLHIARFHAAVPRERAAAGVLTQVVVVALAGGILWAIR